MAEKEQQIEIGDWFVHAHFGAGRVKSQEVKCVGDQEQTYYEIETAVCTLWLPAEQLFGQKIRPLVDDSEFQIVFDVLKEPSTGMASEANKRKMRIKEVKTANMPENTAGLIRDLWVRERTEGKLYDWERQAWRDLSTILIQEWALSQEISADEARRQLDQILNSKQGNPAGKAAGGAAAYSADQTGSLLESMSNDEQKWATWLANATA
jgi:RNA polymerase-interacting CarD/CdnL/TRCF family regulator